MKNAVKKELLKLTCSKLQNCLKDHKNSQYYFKYNVRGVSLPSKILPRNRNTNNPPGATQAVENHEMRQQSSRIARGI